MTWIPIVREIVGLAQSIVQLVRERRARRRGK